jgi:PAS domain S-box-containing protein
MNPSRHALLAIGDLLDILPDAVIMVDAGSRITYANPALSTLLGYTAADLVGQPLSLLVPPDQRERHATLVARYRREGTPTMMGTRPVLHAVHRSGRLVPVSISLCNLCLQDRDSEQVSVAVIHDVTALHTHLDRATAQAETDGLTGLGNRLRLSRRMRALSAGRGLSRCCRWTWNRSTVWTSNPAKRSATTRCASLAADCRPSCARAIWWRASGTTVS